MFRSSNSIALKFAIWAFLGLLLHTSGVAQTTKKRNPTKATTKTTTKTTGFIPTYLTTGFDSSVMSFDLGKGFRGHNFTDVYRKLSGIWSEKSEFESTKEYEKRVDLLKSRNLFGSVLVNSNLAFVLPLTTQLSGTAASANYDADTQTLKIDLGAEYGSLFTNTKPFGSDSSTDLQAFVISNSGPKILRTYIGQTGFGVKRRVTVGEYERASVVFSNCTLSAQSGKIVSGLSTRSATVSLPLSRPEAIDLKYSLGVLLIGHVIPPYSSYKRSLWASPKVDSPIEIWVNESSIFMDLTELWLYSKTTGRVYAKIPECTLKPSDRTFSYLSHKFFF